MERKYDDKRSRIMIKLTEHLIFVDGPNKGRFPFCNGLFINDDVRALIDTDMAVEDINQLAAEGMDIIINSHYHEDHVLHNQKFTNAQVYAHPLDIPGYTLEGYLEMYGFVGEDRATGLEFIRSFGWTPSLVHRELQDGEILDFGHVALKVIHAPGHTPGQCIFLDQESGILFAADIDLTSFGPWYGSACSNINDFIASIKKCMELKPNLIVSSHRLLVTEDIQGALQKYLDIIYRREQDVLQALQTPMSLEQLTDLQIVYGPKVQMDALLRFFEKMSIARHLDRLINLKQVGINGSEYYRL